MKFGLPHYKAETELSTINRGSTADRSRAEIERLLVRYGATGFMYAWEGESQVIAFKIHDRFIRIMLPMPDPADFQLTEETRRRRSADAQQRAYDQAMRQRWRALVLIIKAKLEAIASGITTLEREFLADIVLSNNQTFGQWAGPQIKAMYDSGKLPPLLPSPREE